METIALTTTTREPWNKGKLVGQKTPIEAQRDLGDPRALADGEAVPGTCSFQFGNRQQASSMRSHAAEGARRLPRSGHGISGTRFATEDSTTRSIRNHRAHARRGSGLDHPFSVEARGFSVSKPNTLVTAPIYAAVCQDRRFVGPTTGIGYHKLRYPHA